MSSTGLKQFPVTARCDKAVRALQILRVVDGQMLGAVLAWARAHDQRWPRNVRGGLVVGGLATCGTGEGIALLLIEMPLALVGAAVDTCAYDRLVSDAPQKR
jgi:hypothetical protein